MKLNWNRKVVINSLRRCFSLFCVWFTAKVLVYFYVFSHDLTAELIRESVITSLFLGVIFGLSFMPGQYPFKAKTNKATLQS